MTPELSPYTAVRVLQSTATLLRLIKARGHTLRGTHIWRIVEEAVARLGMEEGVWDPDAGVLHDAATGLAGRKPEQETTHA